MNWSGINGSGPRGERLNNRRNELSRMMVSPGGKPKVKTGLQGSKVNLTGELRTVEKGGSWTGDVKKPEVDRRKLSYETLKPIIRKVSKEGGKTEWTISLKTREYYQKLSTCFDVGDLPKLKIKIQLCLFNDIWPIDAKPFNALMKKCRERGDRIHITYGTVGLKQWGGPSEDEESISIPLWVTDVSLGKIGYKGTVIVPPNVKCLKGATVQGKLDLQNATGLEFLSLWDLECWGLGVKVPEKVKVLHFKNQAGKLDLSGAKCLEEIKAEYMYAVHDGKVPESVKRIEVSMTSGSLDLREATGLEELKIDWLRGHSTLMVPKNIKRVTVQTVQGVLDLMEAKGLTKVNCNIGKVANMGKVLYPYGFQ